MLVEGAHVDGDHLAVDNYGHAHASRAVHKSGSGVHSAGSGRRYGAYAHVRRQAEIRAHGGTHRQRFVAHPDMEPPGNAKYPPNQRFGGYFNKSGGVLVSHSVPAAVQSALKGLTSGFGMGPGVSLSL